MKTVHPLSCFYAASNLFAPSWPFVDFQSSTYGTWRSLRNFLARRQNGHVDMLKTKTWPRNTIFFLLRAGCTELTWTIQPVTPPARGRPMAQPTDPARHAAWPRPYYTHARANSFQVGARRSPHWFEQDVLDISGEHTTTEGRAERSYASVNPIYEHENDVDFIILTA